MSDVSEFFPEAESRREDRQQQHFACLLFDDEDRVITAEIIVTARRAVAMQRAMSLARTSDKVVGFQLWHDGHKVAEYFSTRHAAAGRMVSGPLQRSLSRMRELVARVNVA